MIVGEASTRGGTRSIPAMADESPAPWRLAQDELGGGVMAVIRDANGELVAFYDEDNWPKVVEFKSERVKALILAAPEMEALLRKLKRVPDGYPGLAMLISLEKEAEKIIARIDAVAAR